MLFSELTLPRPLAPQMTLSELVAADYLPINDDGFTNALDTSSNILIETILEAHFANAAVHAEVLHCEEEEERRRWQKYLDELQRECEAAAEERTRQQAAQQSPWISSAPSYADPIPSSSSTPMSSASFSTIPAFDSTTASPAFDQQQSLAYGAAQTQWTQNSQPFTTSTTIIPM